MEPTRMRAGVSGATDSSLSSRTAGFADPQKNVLHMGIVEGATVAEFGAGSGAYVLAVAKIVGPRGKVFAIDVQKDLVTRVKALAEKEHLTNVEIIWGDVERPEGSRLKDESADVVVFSNVLFQLEDKIAGLREARRVLKPKGKLAVIDWADSFGGIGPHEDHVVTQPRALRYLEQAGFALVREFPAGAHHYGLLMNRVQL